MVICKLREPVGAYFHSLITGLTVLDCFNAACLAYHCEVWGLKFQTGLFTCRPLLNKINVRGLSWDRPSVGMINLGGVQSQCGYCELGHL